MPPQDMSGQQPPSGVTSNTSNGFPPNESTTNVNNNTGLPPASRELEMLNDELKELNAEKLKLEAEVNQEEATMKLKESEIKSMQNETETLHQMVKQLDVQKGEARKRLDDLAAQVS